MNNICIPPELYQKANKDQIQVIEAGASLIETIAKECGSERGYKESHFLEQYEQRLQSLVSSQDPLFTKQIEDMKLTIDYLGDLEERCGYVKETMGEVARGYYPFLI